jgi:hypothetical protein
MLSTMLGNERRRRQLFDFNIASNKKIVEQKTEIRGNSNHYSAVYERLGNDSTESQGFNAANSVIRGGSDLLTSPIRWLKDMQDNWALYLVCATIILVCLLVIYVVIRCHWSRRPNPTPPPPSSSGLAELATTIIAMRNMALPPTVTNA